MTLSVAEAGDGVPPVVAFLSVVHTEPVVGTHLLSAEQTRLAEPSHCVAVIVFLSHHVPVGAETTQFFLTVLPGTILKNSTGHAEQLPATVLFVLFT